MLSFQAEAQQEHTAAVIQGVAYEDFFDKVSGGSQCATNMGAGNAGSGSAGAYGSSQAVKDVLGSLLTGITLAQPNDQDQQAIMQGLFPDLACLLPCAICMLHLVRRAAGQLPPHHTATE